MILQSDVMAITKCLISEPLRSCNGTVLNRSDLIGAVCPDGSKPQLLPHRLLLQIRLQLELPLGLADEDRRPGTRKGAAR
jgi:hypothetical protein